MSKYTTQIRWIVEELTKDYQYLSLIERIRLACPLIFNFDYPIWDNNYKQMLEEKIILHYFTREIGLETVGLWKLFLQERLNLIMPYYNELYGTTTLKYNYLWDTDMQEEYNAIKKMSDNTTVNANDVILTNLIGNTIDTINGNENSKFNSEVKDKGEDSFNSTNIDNQTSNFTSKGNLLKSDLPQANYSGLDYGTNLDENTETGDNTQDTNTNFNSRNDRNNTTLSDSTNNVTKDSLNKTDKRENTESTNSKNSVMNAENNTNDTFNRSRTGSSGERSLTELLTQYRNSLINIDKLIIDELKDLFMLIY